MIDPPVGQVTEDRLPSGMIVIGARAPPPPLPPREDRRAAAAAAALRASSSCCFWILAEELLVDPLQRGDLGERPVEASLDLGGVGGLLVAGGLKLLQAAGGLGPLLLGPLVGLFGQLALDLEVLLEGGEPVEQVELVGALHVEQRPLLGRLARVGGVERRHRVVGRRVHEGLHGVLADLLPQRGDLRLLGLDGGGGLGVGLLGLLGSPVGLGQQRLLALHVGLERVERRRDLSVGGAQGVDLAGHLGLLGPDLLPLLGRILVGLGPDHPGKGDETDDQQRAQRTDDRP